MESNVKRVSKRVTRNCVCCGELGPHIGRGLIRPCYEREKYAGTLDRWPLLRRTRDEILNAWVKYTVLGWTKQEIADSLGVTYDAMCQTIIRARKAHDARAIRRKFFGAGHSMLCDCGHCIHW